MTTKSPMRSIDRTQFEQNKVLYDDFNLSKNVAVEQLKVIKSILDDHKKTYHSLITE